MAAQRMDAWISCMDASKPPMPASPPAEDLFSNVDDSLQSLDSEGWMCQKEWASVLENLFLDPDEYPHLDDQSALDSWPLTPDHLCQQESWRNAAGLSSSSTNSDGSSEKGPQKEQASILQANECIIPKKKSKRKRAVTSEINKEMQSKPKLKARMIGAVEGEVAEVLSEDWVSLPHVRENHILTERERRKKMNIMFSSLQAMLPNLSPKADKSTVIDEAISYIHSLEETFQALSKQAEAIRKPASNPILVDEAAISSPPLNVKDDAELAFRTLSSTSGNATINVCGSDAFVNVCSSGRLNSLEQLFSPWESDTLKLLNAHISISGSRRLFSIHAQAEKCSDASMSTIESAFETLSKGLS